MSLKKQKELEKYKIKLHSKVGKGYFKKMGKYEEATTETIILMPDKYRLKEIKEDYKNMTEMFFGEYPSFEELINILLELETEIHKIK